MNKNNKELLLDKALEFEHQNKEDEAIQVYEEIIKDCNDWAIPFYNLGLIYKYRGDWAKSFTFNKEATKINNDYKEAWWNLGIAATALKEWSEAKKAWEGFGLNVQLEDGEVKMDIGFTPIRIDSNEVVWAERICPARARIDNVPTLDSSKNYGDIILNDGAPNGYRLINGHKYSVFDELEVFSKSDYKKIAISVEIKNEYALKKLEEKCTNNDIGFENWTESVRIICKQCSEGIPHEEHDHVPNPNQSKFNIGLATKNEYDLNTILRNWEYETKSIILSID